LWPSNPDNEFSLRKMKEANLRLAAGLAQHSADTTADANSKFGAEVAQALDANPEFKGSLAYNLLKAQVDVLNGSTASICFRFVVCRSMSVCCRQLMGVTYTRCHHMSCCSRPFLPRVSPLSAGDMRGMRGSDSILDTWEHPIEYLHGQPVANLLRSFAL